MSLIIATGSNLNNKIQNLTDAKVLLSKKYAFVAESRIYESKAVGYLDQPSFFNQVLEFLIPNEDPADVMKDLLSTEKYLGRIRGIEKGPRIIDLDIIFWGNKKISQAELTIPHPSWIDRSFVVNPLMELPFFEQVKSNFSIPLIFDTPAHPIN